MKTMFFAGAALAALSAAPAVAQPDRSAEPQTRAAVAAKVQARFARADSNRDGFVTRDEVRARAEARRGQRQAGREQRFDRLDGNDDGVISRAEFDSPRAERGERRAMRGGRGRAGGMMARFGARAFAMMDLDRDGRVALAEAQRAALQRFDRLDSNRDGTISLDERQAARMGRREGRQGD
jgi:Ca2+-binding EF-hand superfamily protein